MAAGLTVVVDYGLCNIDSMVRALEECGATEVERTRDKLRIDTRKWLMSAHNRKRYGETKQIEVAGSISITEALTQARQRVIDAEVVDVTPRQLEQ